MYCFRPENRHFKKGKENAVYTRPNLHDKLTPTWHVLLLPLLNTCPVLKCKEPERKWLWRLYYTQQLQITWNNARQSTLLVYKIRMEVSWWCQSEVNCLKFAEQATPRETRDWPLIWACRGRAGLSGSFGWFVTDCLSLLICLRSAVTWGSAFCKELSYCWSRSHL